MKNYFLVGKRIYLRPLTLKDLKGNYIQWLNDAEVCEYNSHHVFPYTSEEAVEYIENVKDLKKHLILAIVVKESNEHIGNISLQNINYISHNAELTILIGEKKYWNQGLGKESAFLIVQHGFISLNLHRIYCGTISENKGMGKLALRLGMKQEGIRREAVYKNGTYRDITEYGLLRDEFINRFGK